MTKPTLTPSAADQFAAATQALAAVGLTPEQFRALLRATEIVEAMSDDSNWGAGADLTTDDFVEAESDGAYDEWFDEIRDARTYLTA